MAHTSSECAQCHRPMPPSARRCIYCGALKGRRCQKCKGICPVGASVCIFCGAQIPSDAPDYVSTEPRPSEKPTTGKQDSVSEAAEDSKLDATAALPTDAPAETQSTGAAGQPLRWVKASVVVLAVVALVVWMVWLKWGTTPERDARPPHIFEAPEPPQELPSVTAAPPRKLPPLPGEGFDAATLPKTPQMPPEPGKQSLRGTGADEAAPTEPAARTDWDMLWIGSGAALPEPQTLTATGFPWREVEGQQWLMVPTRYHRLYFKPSSDMKKVAELYQHLDNIYVFLSGRAPVAAKPPIHAFLIPGERGRSVCDLRSNAMRTGDGGDFIFNLTSFLHEETHLFNFEAIGGLGQNWWSGEASCQYFQFRARCHKTRKDMKQEILAQLPNEPKTRLGEIDKLGKAASVEATAVLFFLEESYGRERLTRFRSERLHLDRQKARTDHTESAFLRAYGKGSAQLDREWRVFYGWQAGTSTTPVELGQMAMEIAAELTSPRYQGRAAGGPGERLAAERIVQYLRNIGCIPLGESGYLHPFEVGHRDLVGPIGLTIADRQFAYKIDFGVLDGGGTQWVEGEIVYAGYGLSDAKRDDWRGLDAKGKIVMALQGGPAASSGADATSQARARGALGLLIVDPPGKDDMAAYAKRNTKLKNTMPVLHVSSGVGEAILEGSEWMLPALRQAADRGQVPAVRLNKVARMAAGAVYEPRAQSANVMGMLRSPRNPGRYVLIFAHYDGQGRDGEDAYYPSANDNASGVAVMLEVANELAKRQADLPMSVVFAALGAEEIGCVGARKFVESPPFAVGDMELGICLDMVGNGEGQVLVQNISEQAPAYVLLTHTAARLGIRIKSLPRKILGSDAAIVETTGRPVLFLLTGGDKQHRADDNMENVHRDVMGTVVRLLTEHLVSIASSSAPRFSPVQEKLKKPVDYSVGKASVQTIVQAICGKVGIEYDWNKSYANTNPTCRAWVTNVSIRGKSCHQALEMILLPKGLTYRIENDKIVLVRK